MSSVSGLSLALTSLFLSDAFAQKAIMGGSGKINALSRLIRCQLQCYLNIRLILCMSSQYCVLNINFGILFVFMIRCFSCE
jgi:hypothetical protein